MFLSPEIEKLYKTQTIYIHQRQRHDYMSLFFITNIITHINNKINNNNNIYF